MCISMGQLKSKFSITPLFFCHDSVWYEYLRRISKMKKWPWLIFLPITQNQFYHKRVLLCHSGTHMGSMVSSLVCCISVSVLFKLDNSSNHPMSNTSKFLFFEETKSVFHQISLSSTTLMGKSTHPFAFTI